MDIALVVLILGTAGYAAGVALFLNRRLGPAVLAGLLVAASFFAAVGLARVSLVAMILFTAGLTVGSSYAVIRADLGRARAVRVGLGLGVLVTGASLFVSYLAPMAFVFTASTYLVVRRWISTRSALLLMGTALGGLLALSVVVFAVALSQM